MIVESEASIPTVGERINELKKTISATRLSCWLGCRLKFWFRYVVKLPKPASPARHAGSVVHAVLHAWTMERWRGGPFVLQLYRSLFEERWVALQQGQTIDWEDEETQTRESAWRALQLYFTETPIPADERPEGAEVSVEAESPGLPTLRGIIDLVRQGGVIVDYKNVGKKPNEHQLLHQHEVQLSCYSALYRDATGRREGGFELHHLVRTKTPSIVVSRFGPATDAQRSRLLRQIESYVHGLSRNDFVPSPGLQCAACDYFKECRAWH